MTTRRLFVQNGIAAVALAATPRSCFVRDPDDVARHQPFKILFASASTVGQAFGDEAARHGASVLAIGDDIGGLWMREIEPLLRTSPAPLAGLTGGAPLFCLEYLARDHGLRVVCRIEHVRLGTERLGHTGMGPAAVERWADELAASGEDWPRAAARLVTACPAALRPDPAMPLLDLAERPDRAGALFSWVLAPKPSRPKAAPIGVQSEKRRCLIHRRA